MNQQVPSSPVFLQNELCSRRLVRVSEEDNSNFPAGTLRLEVLKVPAQDHH
jgi:hypothetical protein